MNETLYVLNMPLQEWGLGDELEKDLLAPCQQI